MSRRWRWPTLLALLALTSLMAEDGWRLEVTARHELATGASAEVTANGAHGRTLLRVAVLAPGRYQARAFAAAAEVDAFASARATAGVVVAINAGYFDRDRRPLGRLTIDGGERTTPVRQAPLSGLAWADAAGLHLVADATTAAAQAIQAGPFLIDPGGAFGIRSSDGEGARRSALAVARDGTVLAVIATTPLTLHGFASVLQALPMALDLPPIDAALNLDGGPSTALAIAGETTVEPRGFVVSAWGFSAR